MKFEGNWPRGLRGEGVDGRMTDNDGQQVITITHPEPNPEPSALVS